MKSRCGSLTRRCDRSSFHGGHRALTPRRRNRSLCAYAHKMNRKRRVLLVATAGAALGGSGAFTVMAVKDQSYVPSVPYAPLGEPNRDVAVVYYSRSGHSEGCGPRDSTVVQCAHRPDRCGLSPQLFRPGESRLRSDSPSASADPSRADRPRSRAPRLPRVSDVDVPPRDAALGLRGACSAEGQGSHARHDRQQPLRTVRDRRVREAGRVSRRPPHSPCLPAPRPASFGRRAVRSS